MESLNERDRYNLSVHFFVEHDYDSVLTAASDLLRDGTLFPMYMIVLLTGLHLQKTDLVSNLGSFLLSAGRLPSWEQSIVNRVLSEIDDSRLMERADSEERISQAHYYIGACHLLDRNLAEARKRFAACVSRSRCCVEQDIAELELSQFNHYSDSESSARSANTNRADAEIWEFQALLHKLSSDHRPGFVYRGQPKCYSSLVPSGYRPHVDYQHPLIVRAKDESLHRRGIVFRTLLPNSLWPERERRRIDFVSFCRAQLGYPASQLFCQHCCLPTEGLDVSEKPEIAAFFSIFNYSVNNYVGFSEEPGVIFRFNLGQQPSLSMSHIKEIDFYSSPFYLSGVEILNLFRRCVTESESILSLGEYFQEKQTLEMELESWEEIRRGRPLELIALPEDFVQKGRVMMQHAGLIFPDSLLPRSFKGHSVPPPPGRTWQGPQCIEDLAHSDLVETFLFAHRSTNADALSYDPDAIFPQIDPLRSLLSRMISAPGMLTGTHIMAHQDTSVFSSWNDEKLAR